MAAAGSIATFAFAADATQSPMSDASAPAGAMHGKMADAGFAKKAMHGGAKEIALSKIALERGSSADVKKFAQMMIDDHTKAGQELAATVASAMPDSAPPSDAPDKETQHASDKLSKLSGAQFDHAYMAMMEQDHVKTVALFKKEADSGKSEPLKQFAAKTLPTIQGHLDMVKSVKV